MSNTMHIHKKHVIEYASSGMFNWATDKLHYLLDASEITYSVADDDCPEYDKNFDIPKGEVQDAIKALEQIENGEECELDIDTEDLTDCLDNCHLTISEWKKVLQWMLDNSDPKHDSIYVEFF